MNCVAFIFNFIQIQFKYADGSKSPQIYMLRGESKNYVGFQKNKVGGLVSEVDMIRNNQQYGQKEISEAIKHLNIQLKRIDKPRLLLISEISQWHIRIAVEGNISEYSKAIKESKNSIEKYYSECHSFYGVTVLCEFQGKKIIEQHPLSAQYLSFGTQFPNKPQLKGQSTHALVSIDKLKKENITDYLLKSYIIFIYQLWETRFRSEIANHFGIENTNVRCDFFGDLRVIRNSLIHESASMLRKDVENFKVLKFGLNKNLTKGILITSPAILGHIMEQLNLMQIDIALKDKYITFKMCPVVADSIIKGQLHYQTETRHNLNITPLL